MDTTTTTERNTALNIFQRMMLVTSELERVAKSADVGYGKNKYKAVLEGDILKAVKPAESAFGIYSYPVSRRPIVCDIIEQESVGYDESGNAVKNSKNQFVYRIETVYRFVNVDNPLDYLDITSYGDGIDNGDKAPGKAMTYSDKYALMKAYKIETGDDPDKDASPEYSKAKLNGNTQQTARQTAAQPAQARQAAPANNHQPPVTNAAPAASTPSTEWTETSAIPEAGGMTISEIYEVGGRDAVVTLFKATKDEGMKGMITRYMNSLPKQ